MHAICCSYECAVSRTSFRIVRRFLLIDFTPAVVFDSKRFDIVFVTARDRVVRRRDISDFHDLTPPPASITFFLVQENDLLLHGSGYMKNAQWYTRELGASVCSFNGC